MSDNVTVNRNQMYNSSVYHQVQQKGSKLEGLVRKETIKAKSAYFDSIGQVTALKKTGRHSNTPQVDTPHNRRRVTTADYEWADMVDDQDKLRMIWDPTSYYVQAAVMAFGRAKDDVIIEAVSGIAYAGESGETAVVLGTANKIIANDNSGSSKLNVETLRDIKFHFDKQDMDEQINMVIDAKGVQDLLSDEKLTNQDFAVVKALATGSVNAFMGINFIMSNRLVSQNGALLFNNDGSFDSGAGDNIDADGFTKYLAFAKSGVVLAVGEDLVTKIDVRADKSYSTQVYARMSIGGTRLEEEKVLEVLVDPTE